MAVTVSTRTRLFAVSGNRCAFPKCANTLVHGEKVTGEVCHIKAANPGGPRYDHSLTADKVDAFDNLVAMCPLHHTIIDADEVSYTVERLREIKMAHESGGAHAAQHSPGATVISVNQSGGQTAHVINNYGPPERTITPNVRAAMVRVLRQAQRGRIGFACTDGSLEAHNFKIQLMSVFREAGWEVGDAYSFSFGVGQGLRVAVPAEEGSTPAEVAGSGAVHEALRLGSGHDPEWHRSRLWPQWPMCVQVWLAPGG